MLTLSVVLLLAILTIVLVRKGGSAAISAAAPQQGIDVRARVDALFENAPIAYHEIDANGVILRVNRRECNLRYNGIADMIGRHCWDLAPADEQKRYREEILKKLQGETALLPVRRRLLRPNGQPITIEAHESLLRDLAGNVQGMLTASLDITESQTQQEEVFRTTTELRTLFQALPDMLIRLDGSGVVIDVKEGGFSESFAPPGSLRGRRLVDVLSPEEGIKITQALNRLSKTHSMVLVEFSRNTPQRKEIYEARLCPNYRNESIAVVRRITERRESEVRLEQYAQQLEQKNEELATALANAREATEMKSRFLANMSHEIRTPMNGILGMIDFLLGSELTGDQQEYAASVKSSADALLVLINDILDISKIEAGKLRLEPIPFDLTLTVEELAATFAVRARAKGLEFTCASTDDMPTYVIGDPGRVRQVLTNLIGNSIKFTERGKVSVFMELIGESEQTFSVRFLVQDTGIGIAAKDREKLFQSFVQGDSSTTRKYGGTGLGLAITKQLVEMMGGEVGFNSERGRGSTFYFTVVFEKTPSVISVDGDTHALGPLTGHLESVPVIVFGAKGASTDTLVKVLESWKCRVTWADTASTVKSILLQAAMQGRPFRTLLYDTEIEGPSPAEFTGDLRSEARLRDLAFIALAGTGARAEQAALIDAGFASLIPKPVRATQLCEALVQSLKPKKRVEGEAPVSQPVVEMPKVRKEQPAVLLAEDNLINQRIALRMLQKLGVHADVVGNGRDAVEAFSRTPYDLILMDCQMPEMDGFEATSEIRKIEGDNRHTLICALTANAMVGDREKCIAAGMDDYVSKPVAISDLQAALRRLLHKDAESRSEVVAS